MTGLPNYGALIRANLPELGWRLAFVASQSRTKVKLLVLPNETIVPSENLSENIFFFQKDSAGIIIKDPSGNNEPFTVVPAKKLEWQAV
jgi:hypothetical protein